MQRGRPPHARFVRAVLAAIALVSAGTCIAAELPDVVARVKPSVVAIGTFQRTRSPAFVFRGTGFAVGDGRTIATNAHVLPEKLDSAAFESLVVVAPAADSDQQPREARTIAVDPSHDLALLRISGSALRPLTIAANWSVREGQSVAFTGFPIGATLGLFAATHRATISAVSPIALPSPTARQLDPRVVRRINSGAFRILQLDATAYPGNSGSPLYDVDTGMVVGILNMVLVKGTRETALSQPSGISFAVPAQYLADLLGTQK